MDILAQKLHLVLRHETGQAICSPGNIASNLPSSNSVAFRLFLECCLRKLWHKPSVQTAKASK